LRKKTRVALQKTSTPKKKNRCKKKNYGKKKQIPHREEKELRKKSREKEGKEYEAELPATVLRGEKLKKIGAQGRVR